MPSRNTHDTVGMLSGICGSLYLAKDEKPLWVIIESLAGALGGFFGSRLPDLLEPPTCPRHRSVFHSIAFSSGCGAWIRRELPNIQAWLRLHADRYQALSIASGGSFLHAALGVICRLLSGFLAGIIFGYASHLACDATTPSSLPLVF
jgi:hypothetical protein